MNMHHLGRTLDAGLSVIGFKPADLPDSRCGLLYPRPVLGCSAARCMEATGRY